MTAPSQPALPGLELPEVATAADTLHRGANGTRRFLMGDAAVGDGFEHRVRESFARQRVMETIGATLTRVEAGAVEITLPHRDDLTQQHGFVHAGIIATILDSACGYAAFSLMPSDVAVLTVKYKINLLRPASGDRFV